MSSPAAAAALPRIRHAREDELDAVGELTARVYVDEGYVEGDREYVAALRDARTRAAAGEVLVAVDGDELLGAVALFTHEAGPDLAEQSEPGDAVIRMLATDPRARGRGVGTALTQACVRRARELGCRRVRLSSQEAMTGAHRIYQRLGFVRTPQNDWEPVPGLTLMTFELEL